MIQIRNATVKDAIEVANNIRPEDKMEIEGMGHNLSLLPFYVLTSDTSVAFFDDDGTIGGIAGITADPYNPGAGMVWMLCTNAVTKKPHTVVRQAKRWLAKHEGKYTNLWNLADARNHLHHKLLKLLGFTALRRINTGPYFLPYLEIVKLCASP